MKRLELIDAVIIVLTVIAFILIAQKLFGSSPTDMQVAISVFSLLSSFIIKLYFSHSRLNREVGEIKTEMHHRFDAVEKSLLEIKEKL